MTSHGDFSISLENCEENKKGGHFCPPFLTLNLICLQCQVKWSG